MLPVCCTCLLTHHVLWKTASRRIHRPHGFLHWNSAKSRMDPRRHDRQWNRKSCLLRYFSPSYPFLDIDRNMELTFHNEKLLIISLQRFPSIDDLPPRQRLPHPRFDKGPWRQPRSVWKAPPFQWWRIAANHRSEECWTAYRSWHRKSHPWTSAWKSAEKHIRERSFQNQTLNNEYKSES